MIEKKLGKFSAGPVRTGNDNRLKYQSGQQQPAKPGKAHWQFTMLTKPSCQPQSNGENTSTLPCL